MDHLYNIQQMKRQCVVRKKKKKKSKLYKRPEKSDEEKRKNERGVGITVLEVMAMPRGRRDTAQQCYWPLSGESHLS